MLSLLLAFAFGARLPLVGKEQIFSLGGCKAGPSSFVQHNWPRLGGRGQLNVASYQDEAVSI